MIEMQEKINNPSPILECLAKMNGTDEVIDNGSLKIEERFPYNNTSGYLISLENTDTGCQQVYIIGRCGGLMAKLLCLNKPIQTLLGENDPGTNGKTIHFLCGNMCKSCDITPHENLGNPSRKEQAMIVVEAALKLISDR